PAELGDVILDGDVAGALALGADGKADTHALEPIQIDLRELAPLDLGALAVRVHHAALSLQPTLDLDLAVHDRHVDDFAAVLTSELDAALDLEVHTRPGTLHQSV